MIEVILDGNTGRDKGEYPHQNTGTKALQGHHDNDDFTTMDFVVDILRDIFHKDEIEAERLMLLVHETGKAVVGSYPYDIAVSKVQTAAARAKAEGFPFRMTLE